MSDAQREHARNELLAELSVRLGSAVKQAEQAIETEKVRVLRPLGLTLSQYATLMALHYLEAQSAAQLARVVLVTPQTMATVLKNLEAKGLVKRDASDMHSKVMIVRSTPKGKRLAHKADLVVKQVENFLGDAFTTAESTQLRALLDHATHVLTERTQSAENTNG